MEMKTKMLIDGLTLVHPLEEIDSDVEKFR